MSMTRCPECGKEISDKAKSCPNCGAPVSSPFFECEINIRRKRKTAYSARKIQVLVDEREIAHIEDGGIAKISLPQGTHELSFAIGNKVMFRLPLVLSDIENQTNIICETKNSGGITAIITNSDVLSDVTAKSEKPSFLLRALISIPIIIILFYLVSSSMNKFLS